MDLEHDPVQSGYAASLARPGGRITGVFLDMPELVGKWLEMLKEAVPQLARVTVLWDPASGAVQRDAAQVAARLLAIELQMIEVHTGAELDTAFTTATNLRPEALLVLGSQLMSRNSQHIADFAAKSRLPALSPYRRFPEAGGLMSYGPSVPELFRRCGVQVGKILKGAKPGDLPVERPTQFTLVINRKTTQALGLTLPPSLLIQADEVIQ
jgi:putative ABC transport system substrate-binding protein